VVASQLMLVLMLLAVVLPRVFEQLADAAVYEQESNF
jgi:hypothetical protein